MKVFVKYLFAIIIAVTVFCGIASLNAAAFAQDKEIPKDGVSYTLTYPDGTAVTEKDGKPLTYDDVSEALKEENWKLLLTGQVSDANGKVGFPASWKQEGAIKIIETKVPAGYTQGSSKELVTDLKEKSATFLNPKVKEAPPAASENKVKITYDLNGGNYNGSTEDIVVDYVKGTTIIIHDAPERSGYTFDYWKGSEYQPGDKYTAAEDHTFTAQWTKDTEEEKDSDSSEDPADPEDTETPTPNTDKETSSGPRTGDSNRLGIFLLLALVSSSMIIPLVIRRKKYITGIITILLVGTFSFSAAFAADGFVINKIDDSGDPVEGAVFDVYGKPDVSWEEQKPETTSVTVTKVWDDSDDKDGKRPDSVTVSLKANNEQAKDVDGNVIGDIMLNESNGWKAAIDDLPIHDSGKEITYTVAEEEVEGYTARVDGSAEKGFTITNTYTPTTSSVSINVGLSYWIFSGAHWNDVVANPQKVTVSGGSMTDKVLSFTPGTAAQEVELPGAGTYTISMTGITKTDLQNEDSLYDKLFDYMPLLIDTVSVTVTVDESGNCTLSGNPAYDTFVFGMDQGENFVYNDIAALKEAYYGIDESLEKREPHSLNAGASASGNTVTLTTVISQVWDPDTGIEDI